MIVKELIKLLKNICKNHPEAKDADIWFYRAEMQTDDEDSWPVHYVGYDKHRKPKRIKLEE